MSDDNKSGSKIALIIGLVFFTVSTVLAARLCMPLVGQRRQLEEKRNELSTEVSAMRNEIDEMNSRCLRFETDPEFVERQARINKRIGPGEVEFVFDAPE